MKHIKRELNQYVMHQSQHMKSQRRFLYKKNSKKKTSLITITKKNRRHLQEESSQINGLWAKFTHTERLHEKKKTQKHTTQDLQPPSCDHLFVLIDYIIFL